MPKDLAAQIAKLHARPKDLTTLSLLGCLAFLALWVWALFPHNLATDDIEEYLSRQGETLVRAEKSWHTCTNRRPSWNAQVYSKDESGRVRFFLLCRGLNRTYLEAR